MIRKVVTEKNIDEIVFRRVVKRLLSNRVHPNDVERYISQGRALYEEVAGEVRYEKNFLTTPYTPRIEQKEEARLSSADYKVEAVRPF